MREEESVFLGMKRSPRKEDEPDPVIIREKQVADAKQVQIGNQAKYKEALKALTNEIMDVEGYDVMDMKL